MGILSLCSCPIVGMVSCSCEYSNNNNNNNNNTSTGDDGRLVRWLGSLVSYRSSFALPFFFVSCVVGWLAGWPAVRMLPQGDKMPASVRILLAFLSLSFFPSFLACLLISSFFLSLGLRCFRPAMFMVLYSTGTVLYCGICVCRLSQMGKFE